MVEFSVDGPIVPADVPALVLRLTALLGRERRGVVVCRLRDVPATCATIDALARMQLVASRHGCRLAVSGMSEELRELVEFAGMTDVLGV